jgi:peptidoglycan/LPS O-acetylase OafA/YrhL
MACALGTAWVLWNVAKRESLQGLTFPGCEWLGWWGHRSYSLYLWHAPVLRVFVIIAAVQAPWIRGSYYYAYALSLISAVAALYVARFGYWAVERHFINKAPSSHSGEVRPALAVAPCA